MTAESRRRFGALAALIAGLFVTLALLLHKHTRSLGTVLGVALWSAHGVGAAGIPLLGFGISLVRSSSRLRAHSIRRLSREVGRPGRSACCPPS